MALPVVGGIGVWLIGLVGAVATKAFTWVTTFLAYRTAVGVARVVAFMVVAGALTVSVSVAIKALIIGAQVVMPSSLSAFTYFLPGNINQILAIIFTARVSTSLYRWTLANVKIATQHSYL